METEKTYKTGTCALCNAKCWFWQKICQTCKSNAIKIVLAY